MRKFVFTLVFVIIGIIYLSCSTKTANKTGSLSNFTQDIIKTYINDTLHIGINPVNDVLVLYTYEDTNYYYIRIFALDKKFRSHISDPIMGKAKHMGFTIYLTGIPIDLFYKTDSVPVKMPKEANSSVLIDPSYYVIYINKRMELDYLRTYRATTSSDISHLEAIAYKHFKTLRSTESSDQYVFSINEVQYYPEFPGGDNALDSFISFNFKINDKTMHQLSKEFRRTVVCISLLIDSNGNASYIRISQSSGNSEVDQEAIRVAKLITKFRFIPAQHRGCKVSVYYPLDFYDWY